MAVDGARRDVSWCIVGNARCYGGPWAGTPGADPFSPGFETVVLTRHGRRVLIPFFFAIPSGRHPVYCRACARSEAEVRTREQQAELEHQRSFHGAERYVYRTVGPVPPTWIKLARAAALRHPETINPGGLVETYRKQGYLYIELCPPKASGQAHGTPRIAFT